VDGRGDTPAVTIYDVAERAGVSIATVSRVVNGHRSIRPDTQERVLRVIRELGFVPNSAARGLSSGSKKVIGLVFARVPTEDDLLELEEETLLFTDSVIRGAEYAAQSNGYSLLLHGTRRATAASAIASLTSATDGLILADQVLSERQVAPIARRVPVVLLAGSGRSRTAGTVRVDNRTSMHEMAEHLVLVHHKRRLAFLSGAPNSPDSNARATALRETAEALGATVEPDEWWVGDWSSAGAVETVRRRLRRGGPLPDAIACASDSTAIGVQHALSAEGIQVPADIAVTGFDDIPLARHLTPGLTTVNQPIQRLGRVAVEALLAKVKGLPCARDIVLPTRLVVRASCGCEPDPLQALASWRSEGDSLMEHAG
jgi:LacI family transcriptional regulator